MRNIMMFAILAGTSVLPTLQWSDAAHKVIAFISAKFLNYKGKHFVAEHLGAHADAEALGKAMMAVSMFADTVDWSESLHFSHTPYRACADFKMERDCRSGRCIVTGIGNYTARAANVELSKQERAEAVVFLIHLVADIHNPMHVGFEEDAGGNAIILLSPPLDAWGVDQVSHQNLHHVWDYELVKRNQRKCGVFTDNGDGDTEQESYEPWKLSRELIGEIPVAKSQRANYLLKVDSDDFATEAAGVAVASRIASETSNDYTCKYAYKSSSNDWIESGDSLDEEYLSSRAETAAELMKKAGVRLAEILNSLAYLYFKRKQEGKSYIESREPERSAASSHRSVYMDLDFDPEEFLDDSDLVESSLHSTDDEQEGRSLAEEPGVKKFVKRTKKSKKVKAAAVPEFSSNENPTPEDTVDGGMDLNNVILVEREGEYLLVDKKFRRRKGFPKRCFRLSLRFHGNSPRTPVTLFLDSELVNQKPPSDAIISHILAKIQRIASPVSSSAFINRVPVFWAPLRVPASMVPINYNPPVNEIDETPLSVAREVCSFRFGNTHLLTLRDTLLASDPVFRTNLYRIEDRISKPPRTLNLLFDDKLYAGPAPLEMLDKLRINERLSAQILRSRPSLLHELREIDSLSFGTDPDRGFKLEKLKWFIEMRTGHSDFNRLHWSIEPQETAMKTRNLFNALSLEERCLVLLVIACFLQTQLSQSNINQLS